MKKIVFAAALVSCPLVAIGSQEDTQKYLGDLNSDRYCVYKDQVYSIGSILELKENGMRCNYRSGSVNGLPKGAYWDMMR